MQAVMAQRPAVVLEPREQKVAKLMTMLKTRYEDRTERLHVEAVNRLASHRAVVQEEVERKMKKQKEARQAVSRLLSRAEAIKEAKARKGKARGGGGASRGRGRGRGRNWRKRTSIDGFSLLYVVLCYFERQNTLTVPQPFHFFFVLVTRQRVVTTQQ